MDADASVGIFANPTGFLLLPFAILALMWVYAWGVRVGERTMTMQATTTNAEVDGGDLLDTLQISKIERRHRTIGGSWVDGSIGGHRFQALVFEGHAECDHYELADSRISKLWLRPILGDGPAVASFDRAWEIMPATPVAKQIVGLLAAGLAETVYGS